MSKYGQAKMLKLKLENIPSQNHRYRHGDWTDLIYTFYVFSNFYGSPMSYTLTRPAAVCFCVILQRCDLKQTLQREVSWQWRPPSISLMDWKRFTRKSNKPGGRNSRRTYTHTHARQLKICSPGLSNKKDSLFIYSRITAPHFMTTRRLSKCVWVQLHGCSLTCEAQSWKMRTIWNLLFKD